ncbi:MAG TPA: GDP-mannose 4,6-dehydratase [Thermoleophilaceae bacterium]
MGAALAGRPATVYGDGEQSRDFTYVQDVVEASMLAMDSAGAQGRVFNVACGHRITVDRFLDELRALTGGELAVEHVEARPREVRHSEADISLARELLGYAPRFELRDGLERTLEPLPVA